MQINNDPLALDLGGMRNLVQIQAQGMTPDWSTTGAPSESWTTVRTTWAKIATSASVERYLASQFTAEVTHIVTVRYTADTPLAAGMRVLFGTRTFVVQAVDDVLERHIRVNLMCLEVDGVIS